LLRSPGDLDTPMLAAEAEAFGLSAEEGRELRAADSQIDRLELKGEIPGLYNRPAGCEFHPRCPFSDPQCSTEFPQLTELGDEHSYRCHHPRHLA
jgi:ABC-type antimicrobial peptide transport system ATPase subunit